MTFERKPISVKYHITCILTVFFICTVTTLISLILNHWGIGKENLLMLALISVLITTVIVKGYIYGILISLLSVFSFNFFFTEPLHKFAMSDYQDVLLLVFFTVAAIISSMMSSKFQKQTIIARKNEQTTQLMYEISESFQNLTGTANIAIHTMNYLYKITNAGCMIRLDEDKFEDLQQPFCTSADFSQKDFEGGLSFPIKGVISEIGSVTFTNTATITPIMDKIVRSAIYQMALALDRESIYLEREQLRLDMENEHLKNALLRSISHDIRTPLTEISGAGNLIAENIDILSKEEIYKFVMDINTETDWLTMTVQNILNMTRISDGKLNINADYECMDDLLSNAILRLPASYDHSRITLHLPDKIILVRADGNLFVQVLLNLLDNAYKHSGADSAITLSGYYQQGKACFSVSDNGCGINPAIMANLFDNFTSHSANQSDNHRGMGLGLSICYAIISAHGGTLTAENNPEGGSKFTIMLPGDVA